jgi:hypothetical protein
MIVACDEGSTVLENVLTAGLAHHDVDGAQAADRPMRSDVPAASENR